MIEAPRRTRKQEQAADFETKLVSKVAKMVALSDGTGTEELRRQSDRIGHNLYIGRHWNVPIPKRRAAITANVTKALIDHKIAIQTKQDPMPVVEPDDVGDVHAASLMRAVLQRYWRQDNMKLKMRHALRLANTTRTVGAKVIWDPTLHGGAGDMTTDIIPGWRLILDPRTRFLENMQFIGDRTRMSRADAIIRYGTDSDTIDRIRYGGGVSSSVLRSGSSDSPLKSQWNESSRVDSASGSTMINGKPVISAQTATPTNSAKPTDDVDIYEVYFRDRQLVKRTVTVKDGMGEPRKKISRDADGVPHFEQNGDFDDILGEVGFTLVYEEVTEEQLVPKYPHWRRTTVLMPDNSLLQDVAWDRLQPYAIYNDNEPLDGPWMKGCALDLEDLQATLNVSLSTMMDNLRFSSYRAFKATTGSQIEGNNLVLSPGSIVRVGNDINGLQPIEFPTLSESWFNWINNLVSLMERIIGASGIMQGNASEAPRTDSAAGFDSLAEIGGSRIVESTQRFELFIGEIMRIVGDCAQRRYTEKHAIRVEDDEGQLTWERASGPQLYGTFSYTILTGSTMAWNQSGIRKRLIEDMQLGLRDKISLWKNPVIGVEEWQQIKKRIESQPPQLNPPPPPRTRQSGKKPPRPHG